MFDRCVCLVVDVVEPLHANEEEEEEKNDSDYCYCCCCCVFSLATDDHTSVLYIVFRKLHHVLHTEGDEQHLCSCNALLLPLVAMMIVADARTTRTTTM